MFKQLPLRSNHLTRRCITNVRYSSSTTTPSDQNLKHFDFMIEENVKDEASDANIQRFQEKEGDMGKPSDSKFDPRTIIGRADHSITELPKPIAKVIKNNIIRLSIPNRLRSRMVTLFQDFNTNMIQQAPSTGLECNAHIASFFLQDYAMARRVLLELQHRVGPNNFNPQRILDVGYGPATSMVALNEIMGPKWVPEMKEAYIVGRRNNEMKKRAKVILSRQLNENFGKDEEGEQSTTKKENSSKEGAEADETDYFGPIDVKRVNIRTKLRDTLPVTKQYDLIMVHSSLLSRQFSFPKDVDDNIHMILKLLAPNGHLVIIERGNPVGFEIVARARQLMIRPEAYPQESGKIPRPYIKGSAGKPQRLKKESAFVTKEDLEFEEKMLAQLDLEEELEKAREMGEEFEKELIEKYGTVTPEELKFENEEDMEVFEVDTPPEQIFDKVDFHLSVIAPCPHHRKCPLQLGDPKYYKISNHKHRMDICSFGKVVRRPQYTMDIKRGKKLAVKWDKTAEDGIGTLGKKELKSLEGRGRPHGNDTESGSLSYLIVQRSANDEKSIKHIEELRSYSDNVLNNDNPTNWPRIINVPNKVKKNVQMEVCTPEGNMEIWSVPKSLGKQAYHDARKSKQGDLWPLGKKSSVVRNRLSDETKEKLDYLYLTNKKTFKKEQKKKHWKKKVGTSVDDFNDGFLATELMADKLESSSKYKRQAKKANFDVDPSKFDGN